MKKLKKELKPMLKLFKYTFLIVITILSFYLINNYIDSTQKIESEISIENYIEKDSVLFHDKVLKMLFKYKLEHPYIVMAQALEESGRFNSKIFKENKNLFGMTMPWNRATLAIDIKYGHAVYLSCKESIIDYALFQMAYMKGLNREQYFDKLSNYAENKDYVDNLKKIMKEHGWN